MYTNARFQLIGRTSLGSKLAQNYMNDYYDYDYSIFV